MCWGAWWCAVCMIDWRRHKTAPVHLRGKKRVTTLVIFHHTPGPFVRLPAGIMTTMKTPDAAATGEQMALSPAFCVWRRGRTRDAKKPVRRTHKSLMAEINHANLISAVELKLISALGKRECALWPFCSAPTGNCLEVCWKLRVGAFFHSSHLTRAHQSN